MPLLHALASYLRAVREALETCTNYALDTFLVCSVAKRDGDME